MSNRSGIIAIAILAIHFLFTQLFTDYFSKAPLREVIDLKSTYSENFTIYFTIAWPIPVFFLSCDGSSL